MPTMTHYWRICLRHDGQKFTRWVSAIREQEACDKIRIAYPEDTYDLVSVEFMW